jgi:hypothetical protein
MYYVSVELSAISVCNLLDQCMGTPARIMMNPVRDGTNLVRVQILDAIPRQNQCRSMHLVIGFCLVSL